MPTLFRPTTGSTTGGLPLSQGADPLETHNRGTHGGIAPTVLHLPQCNGPTPVDGPEAHPTRISPRLLSSVCICENPFA